MNRVALASIAAGLTLSAACTQQTAQQLNTANGSCLITQGTFRPADASRTVCALAPRSRLRCNEFCHTRAA